MQSPLTVNVRTMNRSRNTSHSPGNIPPLKSRTCRRGSPNHHGICKKNHLCVGSQVYKKPISPGLTKTTVYHTGHNISANKCRYSRNDLHLNFPVLWKPSLIFIYWSKKYAAGQIPGLYADRPERILPQSFAGIPQKNMAHYRVCCNHNPLHHIKLKSCRLCHFCNAII